MNRKSRRAHNRIPLTGLTFEIEKEPDPPPGLGQLADRLHRAERGGFAADPIGGLLGVLGASGFADDPAIREPETIVRINAAKTQVPEWHLTERPPSFLRLAEKDRVARMILRLVELDALAAREHRTGRRTGTARRTLSDVATALGVGWLGDLRDEVRRMNQKRFTRMLSGVIAGGRSIYRRELARSIDEGTATREAKRAIEGRIAAIRDMWEFNRREAGRRCRHRFEELKYEHRWRELFSKGEGASRGRHLSNNLAAWLLGVPRTRDTERET